MSARFYKRWAVRKYMDSWCALSPGWGEDAYPFNTFERAFRYAYYMQKSEECQRFVQHKA